MSSSHNTEIKLNSRSTPLTICRWLILWTFRIFHYAFTPTSFFFFLTCTAALNQKTFSHSHLPTKPPWVLSACPHIQPLIHYQWGCSRKCCMITSHTGLGSFWSFWSNLSVSIYLNPAVQNQWEKMWEMYPRVDCCFQCDPDLTVRVQLCSEKI